MNRLVTQGVVVREIPQDNRRSVQLFLAPEFIEDNRSLFDYKTKFMDDIFNFQGLTPEDADTIIYAFGKVENLFQTPMEK